MKNLNLANLLAACAIALTTEAASASVIYTYTGNNYSSIIGSTWNTSMNISGSLELGGPLGGNFNGTAVVQTFSFTDGINLYSESNSEATFSFTTNPAGTLTDWGVSIISPTTTGMAIGDPALMLSILNVNIIPAIIITGDSIGQAVCIETVNNVCTNFAVASEGAYNFSSGTWTASAVPLPASAWLLSTGLIGLLGMARRIKGSMYLSRHSP